MDDGSLGVAVLAARAARFLCGKREGGQVNKERRKSCSASHD